MWTSKQAGERVFSVLANGEPLIRDLDVTDAAGGTLIALQKSVEVTATNGNVTLEFKPTRGEAIVSAIEVQ